MARNKPVSMMEILHLLDRGIPGSANVVMRSEYQTGSFALEESPHRFDLFSRCRLISDVMIQTENQKRIGIVEHSFVERKLEARLINPLKHRNRITGDFTDKFLKRSERPEK